MPSLHTVGATEDSSFQMHFHLGTNPRQTLPKELCPELFSIFIGWLGEFVNFVVRPKVV